jgi:hypothetical protein
MIFISTTLVVLATPIGVRLRAVESGGQDWAFAAASAGSLRDAESTPRGRSGRMETAR